MTKQASRKKDKRENRFVRYLRGVRAEMRKVTWPTREMTLRLTGIVLAVTVSMSAALGVIDWALSKLFTLLIN